ncbi:MAG: competence protein CoiA family protein [Eubacteriales bacterium]
MEEIQTVYGLKNGELIHVDQVESGEKCGCFCPACHGKLIARKGAVKRHHFAHKAEGNCSHAYETTLHLLAKKIISESEKFWLPKLEMEFDLGKKFLISNGQKISVGTVELEQRYHPIIPDVVVHSIKGPKLMVEIFVTHEVDEEKLEKIKNIGISAIEIDLSQHRDTVTEKELKKILLGESKEKYWLFNRRKAEYLEKFLAKTVHLPLVYEEVSCCLKLYPGSVEDDMVSTEHCYHCQYFWEENEETLLCSGRLRLTTLEHILATEEEDVRRVLACEVAEAKARAKAEYLERIKQQRKEKYHANLNEGKCPWCEKNLKFTKRKWDSHRFLSCTAWICEEKGCQFTLDLETNAAKNSAFVQQYENLLEKYKEGKGELKCGWCKKPLVHHEPKPDSIKPFEPFMGCSGFPKCQFTVYYSREELHELNRVKKVEQERLAYEKKKEENKDKIQHIDLCISKNLCPLCEKELFTKDFDTSRVSDCEFCEITFKMPFLNEKKDLEIPYDKFL